MSRRNKLLLVAFLALGSALAVFETRLVSTQRAEQHAISTRLDEARLALARAQHQRDGLARDLALAEQQLTRASALTVPVHAPTAADQTVAAWHARAKQLRALAAAQPASLIPELKLLTDEDWLRVAQTAAFATDEQRRQALAALRTAAKRHFAALLSTALREFKAARANALPTSPLDLAPFLSAPADPAMLARYSIFHDGPTATTRDAWIIRETAAVDADSDSRHSVSPGGGYGSSSGLSAWQTDLAPRLQRARQAYTTANQGTQPTSIAQVVPFIDPPLPPATLEKLLQAERTRPR